MVGGAATFADTSEATYRAVPVAFGVGLLFLFWFLRDALGRAGSVWAAILAGCSPAFVFYSRYYIHETLLAFFTLATLAFGWRYLRSGRLAWCLAAGVTLGLMQATKETAAIAYLAALSHWRQSRYPRGVRGIQDQVHCIGAGGIWRWAQWSRYWWQLRCCRRSSRIRAVRSMVYSPTCRG